MAKAARAWHRVAMCMALCAATATAAADEVDVSFDEDTISIDFVEPMRTLPNVVPSGLVTLDGMPDPHCTWDDDTAIECALPEGSALQPATAYRVRIGTGLYTQTGAPVCARSIVAETDRPALTLRVAGWGGGLPQVDVRADARVSSDAIADVLRVRLDGKSLAYRLEPQEFDADDDERGYRVHLAPVAGADRRLEFEERPGLRSDAGPLRGKGGAPLRVVANESPRLRDAGCQVPGVAGGNVSADGPRLALTCVPEESVALEFSQPLDAVSVGAWMASWPRGVTLVDSRRAEWYAWSGTANRRPGHAMHLRVETPATTLSLPSTDLLRTVDGESVVPVAITITTVHRQPRIDIRQLRSVLAAPVAADTAYAQAIAAREVDVALFGIGERAASGTLRIPQGARDERVPVTSAWTQRVLDEGGWVRWTVQPGKGESGRVVQFVAPDFDLQAVFGLRDVLVWANAWDRDAPIEGAAVELLRLDPGSTEPVVAARGTTAADGTALLRLPDASVAKSSGGESPHWLLRATHGPGAQDARAVLPLGEFYDSKLGGPRTDRLWGVTDRPMYRAGDTVKYRLWLREERNQRLVRAAGVTTVPLVLHERGESIALAKWDAPVDDRGGLVGEVALPSQLPDKDYCISRKEDGYGACFFVGTFRGQDLWVELAPDRKLVREGDVLGVTATAGYYSSGRANGVAMDLQSILRPWPIDEAFPDYARYTFGDVDPEGVVDELAWEAVEDLALVADADGSVRGAWPLHFRRLRADPEPFRVPLFGKLELTAGAKGNDREGTYSPAAEIAFAGAERFVGVRIGGDWYDARAVPRLEAVVLTAEGKPVADAAVEVDVVVRPEGKDQHNAGNDVSVGHCSLRTGHEADCAVDRSRTGRYVFTATAPDAVATKLERYHWTGRVADAPKREDAGLEVLEDKAVAGRPVRLRLRQPFASARVLLLARGTDVLSHRVVRTTGEFTPLALPTGADWVGDVEVRALVHSPAAATIEEGMRVPVGQLDANVMLDFGKPAAARAPIVIAFEPTQSQPGATVRLRVRNDSDQVRDVAIAVVDDAVRALAADILVYSDPQEFAWLGEEASIGHWQLNSFAAFDDHTPAMRLPLPWPKGELEPVVAAANARLLMRKVPADGLDTITVTGSRIQSQTVTAASPVVAIQPEEFQYSGGTPSELDRIVVTGTRLLKQLDEGSARVPGVRPRESGARRALARVRNAFRDGALWVPDLRLAPGESRTFDVVLPDNLTRWHATAWSSDAGDGFATAEATLEASLPIEVRVQAPVRIYPGDQARIAANVRRAGSGTGVVEAALVGEGAGLRETHTEALTLAPGAQSSIGLAIAPDETGSIVLLARGAAAEGSDAVGNEVEVASPRVPVRVVQAGWLGDAAVVLPLPALPASAGPAEMRLVLQRGGSGLVRRWTQDMHDYPHRCWEQILSRGVAAALALARHDPAWPDADAAVREALGNAAVFQDEDGGFRYFVQPVSFGSESWRFEPVPQVALTAYSVRALGWLRDLGHAVDPDVVDRAREFLEEQADEETGPASDDEDRDQDDAAYRRALAIAVDQQALAVGGLATRPGDKVDADALATAWSNWERQSLPAKLATARALEAEGDASADKAIARLLALAPLRGGARRLGADPRGARWMGSALHEQCELIALLGLPGATDAQRQARGELLAGLTDLYSGGIATIDTQAGAQCLHVLQADATADAAPHAAHATLGGASHELVLAADAADAQWTTAAPAGAELRIARAQPGTRPDSYVAELSYDEDARTAQASAVGLAIERRYEVFRDARWMPVDGAAVHEGDWIRITLVVTTGAPRHFVAVTDAVPGGLQPTDLHLQGVAGVQLESMSATGSSHFDTRRLDPRAPRFYAEYLPAGRHEIHYFARVGNSGDYLAAPAVAELMYGDASRARTAARRLRIEHADGP
jgi:uncharacterized protein YfaS (alpha-2-macroglobulin family)